MTDAASADPQFIVSPYRFSSNPEAMSRFLATVGLRQTLGSQGGGFAIFAGRSGMVAVHRAHDSATAMQPGQTSLNFAVRDVRGAAADLVSQGHDVAVWDESYGVQGGLRDPRGQGIWLNEEIQADLYGGYTTLEPEQPSLVDVVACYLTTDFVQAAAFFAPLGFAGGPLDDPWWCALRGSDGSGVVGLHSTEGVPEPGPAAPEDPVGPPALVLLSFQTAEPLEELAARLRAAGFADARCLDEEAGPQLRVTDPDGCEIEIFPVAR